MIKIAAISDTHMQHDKVVLPDDIDLLLHTGDMTHQGRLKEYEQVNDWFGSLGLPKDRIICIAGNHDFDASKSKLSNAMYLEDEPYEIDGIKIYGRPWTPEFMGWAFMADPGSQKMIENVNAIPLDTEILLTHGPAYGILDACADGRKVGCQDLLKRLPELVNLETMVFGHIHHSSGTRKVNGVEHINAAILNDNYKHKFGPKIFYKEGK